MSFEKCGHVGYRDVLALQLKREVDQALISGDVIDAQKICVILGHCQRCEDLAGRVINEARGDNAETPNTQVP